MRMLSNRWFCRGAVLVAAVACIAAFSFAQPLKALASVGPSLTVTITPAVFPSTELGSDAPLMVATVTNTSYVPSLIELSYLGDNTNFSVPSDENSCFLKFLFKGQSCTTHIYFTPQRTGYFATALRVWHDGLSKKVALIEGSAYVPPLMPSTTEVDFGKKTIGSGSESRFVRLFNKALVPITVTDITASGSPFGVSKDCARTIEPDDSCDMEVSFEPTQVGVVQGYVTVRDSYGHDQEIDLYGEGIPAGVPDISISTTRIRFDPQLVGTTSAAYPVTVTSTGQADLIITDIAATGDFAIDGDCTGTFAPAESCTFGVTFTPSIRGDAAGTVTLTDNAHDEPTQTIALSGVGYEPGHPSVELSATEVDFGPQAIGTTGEIHYVVLTNIGDAELEVSSVESSREFTQENDCVGPVAAGGRCAVATNFAPQTLGDLNGLVTIEDSASGSPRMVALRGTGVPSSTPQASLSADSLDFGEQAIQEVSQLTLTVTNVGDSDLDISLTSIEGEGEAEFGKADGCCGSVVEPGTSCTIDVFFLPLDEGTFSASLVIDDNTADSPHEVGLIGRGVSAGSSGGCALCAASAAGPMGAFFAFAAAAVVGLGRFSARRRR